MPTITVRTGKVNGSFPVLRPAGPWRPAFTDPSNGSENMKQPASHDVVADDLLGEWDDYAKSIIDSIESGFLDSHLKTIAQVAYRRATKIGQTPKSKGNSPQVEKSVNLDGTVQIKRDMSYGLPAFPLTAAKAAQLEAQGGTTIAFCNRRWNRSDFIGQEFVIRPGTYKDDRYDGLVARITGMGDKTFKVSFPYANDGSKPNGPSGTKDMAFISLRRAMYLFDMKEK